MICKEELKMAFCSNCGAQLPEGAQQCPNCNAVITGVQSSDATYPWDHTAEFTAEDISDNKVYALIAYGLGAFGLIVAMICAKDSAYVRFHCRESAKLLVVGTVVGVLTAALCWTCIALVAGVVLCLIIMVLYVIAFVQVCKGQAKEPWLIRSIGALH